MTLSESARPIKRGDGVVFDVGPDGIEQGEAGGSVYGIEDPATRAPIADEDVVAGSTVLLR